MVGCLFDIARFFDRGHDGKVWQRGHNGKFRRGRNGKLFWRSITAKFGGGKINFFARPNFRGQPHPLFVVTTTWSADKLVFCFVKSDTNPESAKLGLALAVAAAAKRKLADFAQTPPPSWGAGGRATIRSPSWYAGCSRASPASLDNEFRRLWKTFTLAQVSRGGADLSPPQDECEVGAAAGGAPGGWWSHCGVCVRDVNKTD
jgi:hypothetical protein